MEGIFDNADSENYIFQAENFPGIGCDIFRHIGHAQRVAQIGTVLFSKPDGQHLHQSAFVFPVEIRVGLDPADGDDAVSLRRIFVNMYRETIWSCGNLDSIHAGKNRTSHGFFCDAVPGQHFQLSFSSSASVASHSRKNERRGTAVFDKIHNSLYYLVNIGDFTAACSNSDAHTGSNSVFQLLFSNVVQNQLRNLAALYLSPGQRKLHGIEHWNFRVLKKFFKNIHIAPPMILTGITPKI